MKVLFVPSKYNLPFSINNILLNKLPKIVGLVTTIQHIDSLNKVKNFLEKHNKKVKIGKSKKDKNKNLKKGQVLGCDVTAASSIKEKVHAFLYIGSGKFHPLQISLATDKPVFIFNPLTQEFTHLRKKEIIKAKERRKTAKIRFLSSNSCGILVSTKPGQNKLKQALKLKNKLRKEGKLCYIFLFDNFQAEQLENFPSIECWINTICPGLSLENPFPWIEDI